MPTLDEFLLNVRAADVLDVLVVSVLLYVGFSWLRRRAAHAVVVTFLLVGTLYATSRLLNMYLTLALFQAGITLILFALIVVFHQDVRHGLERLAAWRPRQARDQTPPRTQMLNETVEAIEQLAEKRIGALLVFPGRQPLDRQTRGGTQVDAEVSIPLLMTIFYPGTAGHDGAVIVEGERVMRMGVHLPLSTNLAEVGRTGTRHAAALGLAESSDALVIAVSEERGTVSLAHKGKLERIEAGAGLAERLESFLGDAPDGVLENSRISAAGAAGMWLACLVVASLLWFAFAFQINTVQTTVEAVPVQFENVPAGWRIDNAQPATVELALAGPERAINAMDRKSLKVSVNLEKIKPSREPVRSVQIAEGHLVLPPDVSLQAADPPEIKFQAYEVTTQEVPVSVLRTGEPAAGFELAILRPDPARVLVEMPRNQTIEILQTTPVDVSGMQKTQTREVKLADVPPHIRFPKPPPTIKVTVEVRPKREGAGP